MDHIQIIGAGQMGTGIAQVCLSHGFSVTLVDASSSQLEKAKESLQKKLTFKEENLTLSPHPASTPTAFLIEAIAENLDVKKSFWQGLDTSKIEILASNTSSYSITELASFTHSPDRFIGIHFMNPPSKMPLVEIIRGEKTSDLVFENTYAFIQKIEKTPVTSKDSPGFIVNRILIPMINNAISLFEEGVGTAENIDTAMKLGAAHPMGPLALADLIGLDTCLAIMKDLYHRTQNPGYAPTPLLKDMVEKGHLGRKSGRGFFEYDRSH